MIKFVKNITLFSFLIGILIFFNFSFNKQCIERNQSTVPDSVRILITGTSHARMGLNPAIIKQSLNISEAAEPLFVSYIKLKELLPYCDSVRAVVISCSLDEIVSTKDLFLSGDETNSGEFFKRLFCKYSTFSYTELKAFELDKFELLTSYIRYRLFPNYSIGELAVKSYVNNTGVTILESKFRDVERLDDMEPITYKPEGYEELIKKHFDIPDGVNPYSTISINYLDSIAHISKKYNKELVILGFPLHQEFVSHVPKHFVNRYKNLQSKIMGKYPQVAFWDFTSGINSHSYFIDYGHLTLEGASFLSHVLNDSIYNTILPDLLIN